MVRLKQSSRSFSVNTKLVAFTAATAVSVAAFAGTAVARDQVKVAGSSTVLPYANIVAEEFGKTYNNLKTPIIESGGSSAGLKLFCQGLGPNTIDVANASRKIREKEIKACADAGVKNIVEVSFGYDGIVFATDVNGPSFKVTPKDVYLALAAQVPVDGKMADNPNKTWKDVNDKFPAWDIVAYIPGEKHGTREVFEDKLLEVGCEETGAKKMLMDGGMAKKAAGKACIAVRKDGGTVDIDGDYTETLGRLQANKTGVGVFGLSFYENNTDKLKVATINDVTPSVETISTGKYPVSRPLFFYVKKDHVGVIPGLKEYVEFFTSEKMIGEDGPLAEYGLVPMPKNEFEALQGKVKDMKTM
ncbi:MAG: substrate-binding domain-containing protein [Pseudomonadota bacterium]